MITVMCLRCGGPAFLYEHQPVHGEAMKSSLAAHLDGTPIAANTKYVCETCWRYPLPLKKRFDNEDCCN
jgi:hypothetical protein